MSNPQPPILGIPKHWEYFLLSLMLVLFLPLLPLLLELFATHEIKPASIALTIAIYSVSIGVATRSQVIFGLCISICYAVAYGLAVKNPSDGPAPWACWATVAAVFIIHGIERYQRHVQQRAPFLEFM